MGNYLDFKNYFEDLATKHLAINHDSNDETKKKFFEVMLEEIISGITHKLPGKEDGPFLIYTGYLDRVNFKEQNIKNRELMFFVMQSVGVKDYSEQATAKNRCESIVDDFLSKMMKDSREDLALFDNALDTMNNVSIIPNEFKIASTVYVGWQVSISLVVYPNLCFNQSNWQI